MCITSCASYLPKNDANDASVQRNDANTRSTLVIQNMDHLPKTKRPGGLGLHCKGFDRFWPPSAGFEFGKVRKAWGTGSNQHFLQLQT